MTMTAWILAAVWLLLSPVVSVTVGRMIALADRIEAAE